MNHTPEPWEVHRDPLHFCTRSSIAGNDGPVAEVTGRDVREQEANSDRIVACVNALTGVANPAEELARLRAVEKQNAALRASWEEMKRFLKHIGTSSDCGCRPCRGQCISPEADKIWIEEVESIAEELLANAAKVEGGGN